MSKEKRLSLIVPVYYEEEVLPIAYPRMKAAMEQTGHDYEIIFVNDGSRDGTMRELRRIAAEDKRVKVLSFSRLSALAIPRRIFMVPSRLPSLTKMISKSYPVFSMAAFMRG